MKKRILCALLALCMIASLLPLTVLAADPTVAVVFFNKDNSTFTVTAEPGTTKYVTTNTDGLIAEWTDTAAAPADNFIKLDYPADGNATLKVTLKNIFADSVSSKYHAPAIEFGEGDYAIALELVGANKITDGNSAGIKYNAAKGMTVTGAGSLSIALSASAAGAFWANGGDLLIKDTTMDITVAQGNHSLHHAIFASKGSVTIENTKLTTTTDGGACVYLGTTDDEAGGAGKGRYTPTKDSNRFIKIKDSEVTVSIKQNKDAFCSAAPAVISNTTLKITLGTSTGPLFTPVPTFEGEYTAIAGLAKNAEKLDKLKEFNPKKVGSYTYFYMVPGKVDLLPTTEPVENPTTGPTEPATTEATEAPTTEATVPDETENSATKPTTGDKDEATKPTTGEKNEATKPTTADKNDKTDKTDDAAEEKSGSPLKVVLIILIVLLVAGGAAVGVILYLRSKNAAAEEGEEEEAEEETEAEAEEE